MKAIIAGHNAKVLSNTIKDKQVNKKCSCKDATKCPLDGYCLQEAVIYKATITTPYVRKTYIGSTEATFKQRFYGHTSDLTHIKNRNNTTLAAFVWELRDKGQQPEIKWEAIKKCSRYKCGTRKCDVCLSEKLAILRSRDPDLLNKRSELMARCPHRRKWRLETFKLK